MADEVTLDFLAHQMDRVLTEIGSLRDDMRVMAAILQRLERGEVMNGWPRVGRASHKRPNQGC